MKIKPCNKIHENLIKKKLLQTFFPPIDFFFNFIDPLMLLLLNFRFFFLFRFAPITLKQA